MHRTVSPELIHTRLPTCECVSIWCCDPLLLFLSCKFPFLLRQYVAFNHIGLIRSRHEPEMLTLSNHCFKLTCLLFARQHVTGRMLLSLSLLHESLKKVRIFPPCERLYRLHILPYHSYHIYIASSEPHIIRCTSAGPAFHFQSASEHLISNSSESSIADSHILWLSSRIPRRKHWARLDPGNKHKKHI